MPPIEPVAIFHTGRCGSTVIERMLRQHANIAARSEIFAAAFTAFQKTNPGVSAEAYLDHRLQLIARNRTPEQSHFTFEVKYLAGLDMALFAGGLSRHLDILRAHDVSNAVVLTRKNGLRRIVSTLIATERQSYHRAAGTQPDEVTAYLDVDRVSLGGQFELVTLLEHLDCERSALLDGLAERGFRFTEVFYEDHIEPDPRIACDLILRFLDLPKAKLTPTLARIQTAPLSKTLRNYDAVARRLTDTRFEWMLQG